MQYIRSVNKQNHFKAKQPGRCAKKWYILTFLILFGISLTTSSRFEIKISQFLLKFTVFFAISCWNLTVKQLFNVGDSWFINSRIKDSSCFSFSLFLKKKIIKFMERNNEMFKIFFSRNTMQRLVLLLCKHFYIFISSYESHSNLILLFFIIIYSSFQSSVIFIMFMLRMIRLLNWCILVIYIWCSKSRLIFMYCSRYGQIYMRV